MPDLKALCSIVPELRDAEVVCSLTDGPLSDKWQLRAGQRLYAVRIDRRAARLIGLDRRAEYEALRSLAAAGWSDAPVYAETSQGVLVMHWVAGTAWAPAQFHEPAFIGPLAHLLCELHTARINLPPFELAARNRAYAAVADSVAVRQRAAEVEAMLDDVGQGPGAGCACHNDPVAGNVLSTATGPRLIDFEYAASNNSHFDLAAVIEHHDLGAAGQKALLDAYAGAGGSADRAALEVWRRIYSYTCANWAAATGSVRT